MTCLRVDEDGLHETAGIVPVASSYTALCLLTQQNGWLPGERLDMLLCDGNLFMLRIISEDQYNEAFCFPKMNNIFLHSGYFDFILIKFSDLMLLVKWQERHPACKI